MSSNLRVATQWEPHVYNAPFQRILHCQMTGGEMECCANPKKFWYYNDTEGHHFRNLLLSMLMVVMAAAERMLAIGVALSVIRRKWLLLESVQVTLMWRYIAFIRYRARLKSGPQVAWMLQARPGRSGKQNQEKKSPNPGTPSSFQCRRHMYAASNTNLWSSSGHVCCPARNLGPIS